MFTCGGGGGDIFFFPLAPAVLYHFPLICMYFCLRTRARVLVSCVCQWSPAGIRRSQYDAVCFQSKTTQNSTSHKNRANPETIEPENRRPSERRAKKIFVENHCGFLPTCEVNGWESRAVRMFVCAGAAKCSILVRLCFSMRRDCTVQLDGHAIYDQRHRSCWGEYHQPTSSITVVMFLSSFRHYKSTRQCCCCQWNGIRCGRQTPTTMHFIRTSLSLSQSLRHTPKTLCPQMIHQILFIHGKHSMVGRCHSYRRLPHPTATEHNSSDNKTPKAVL